MSIPQSPLGSKEERSYRQYVLVPGEVKAGSGPSYHRKQMILEKKARSRAENILNELEDQFKADKAPQYPTTSTFLAEPSPSHRVDKSSDKDSIPIGKTRTNTSKELNIRIEKAKAMGDYKFIEANIHSLIQATMSLVSAKEETLAVYLTRNLLAGVRFLNFKVLKNRERWHVNTEFSY
ncbi:unnamed protein product [Mytilus coruscus]|uniref:Uncharacterized protein n=1 Tax=Mytilus coruscus TaxID=42192 RepID=A0A6J8A0H2_MYTCO|nr:unnamed protein product [Mytilus coruscus]